MFYGGCEAVWGTGTAPTADGRGQQCTSADAAGFPIAPLLFSAEEVAAGEINHAIRFILPNDMIRTKQYVYPATHGTNTTGPMTSIPYGGHMRLRADFPLDTLKPAAQVVARAMQKYGMYMSDGGNIALTTQADVVGCAKWADVDLEPGDLETLLATDFEVSRRRGGLGRRGHGRWGVRGARDGSEQGHDDQRDTNSKHGLPPGSA